MASANGISSLYNPESGIAVITLSGRINEIGLVGLLRQLEDKGAKHVIYRLPETNSFVERILRAKVDIMSSTSALPYAFHQEPQARIGSYAVGPRP